MKKIIYLIMFFVLSSFVFATDLTSNWQVCHDFEDNSGVDYLNNLNLTYGGTPTIDAGWSGNAINFTTTNDYARETNNVDNVSWGTDVWINSTMCFGFNLNARVGDKHPVCLRGASGYFVRHYIAGNTKWDFNFYAPSSMDLYSDSAVAENTWIVYCKIVDNTNGIHYYNDGTQDGTQAFAHGLDDVDLGVYLSLNGGGGVCSSIATLTFDTFSIWNRTLSVEDIQTYYNSGNLLSCAEIEATGVPPDTCSPTSPLTSNYQFEGTDNCVYTDVLDAGGYSVEVTPGGSLTIEDSGNIHNYANIFAYSNLFCYTIGIGCFG